MQDCEKDNGLSSERYGIYSVNECENFDALKTGINTKELAANLKPLCL